MNFVELIWCPIHFSEIFFFKAAAISWSLPPERLFVWQTPQEL